MSATWERAGQGICQNKPFRGQCQQAGDLSQMPGTFSRAKLCCRHALVGTPLALQKLWMPHKCPVGCRDISHPCKWQLTFTLLLWREAKETFVIQGLRKCRKIFQSSKALFKVSSLSSLFLEAESVVGGQVLGSHCDLV